MVTSILQLNVSEEKVFELRPFAVPADAQITLADPPDALQLFTDEARRVRDDFALDRIAPPRPARPASAPLRTPVDG